MDPVTALGAAGSVIGIAGFGFQLSAAIYQLYSHIGDAKDSVQAAVDGIDSTAVALNRIHDFLQVEEENLRQGKGLLLFSSTAILGVKDTAHKCLAIFWRIEATITNKTGPKFEDELLQRLLALKRDTGSKPIQPVFKLDSSLTEAAASIRNRFRWTFRGDFSKLEGYSRRLQQFQLSLTLMFSVVSLGIQRSHQQENWKQTAAYNFIRGIAVQRNIHSIAAQFSHDREPDRISLSVTKIGDKDFDEMHRPIKGDLEQNLPGVSSMDQRQRVPAYPPTLDFNLPTSRRIPQPRSREQMGPGGTFAHQSHRSSPPSSELGTAAGLTDVRCFPAKTPRTTGTPVETILAINEDRLTSGTQPKIRIMKPETDTVYDPRAPGPRSKKSPAAVSATAVLEQGQGSIRRAFEAKSTGAIQMSSQQEASRPRSATLESSWEGSSSTVPETQKCLYIIREGKYHAIPHCLDTGLRGTVGRTLGLRQSQKSVLKKLASLSPENTVALQYVLGDEGSGVQTRKLVQLSIVQKSTFRIGGRREPTVMAVVENLNPNGKVIPKCGHSFSPPSTDFETPSHGGCQQPVHQQAGPELYGETDLPRHRPNHAIQDVSTDMMNVDDYQKQLTTYRVWVIEPHSKVKHPISETQSWVKCTVVEEIHNHDDIVQRLLILDRKTLSADLKRLSLRPDQQSQIVRLHDTMVKDEICSEYQWGVRQLDLIRSRSRIFQLIPTITSIVVYLERSPREHVDLRRLFVTQGMYEKDDTQTRMSTTNGLQPFSAPQPAQHYNHSAPYSALDHPPYVPYGHALPAPPQAPPETPAAPYNPHGPPDVMQPPKSNLSRGLNKNPVTSSPPALPKQESFADKSSDKCEVSSSWSGVDATETYPRKCNSRGWARLVPAPRRRSSDHECSVAHRPPMPFEPYQAPDDSNLILKTSPPMLDVQAEARLALEDVRVRETLQSSGPDTRLAERWPIYPSQFDNMPYDPQRNADDEIINQLLLDWTPQRANIAHGDGKDNVGIEQGFSSVNKAVDGEEGRGRCRTSLVTVGNYYDFSEHSSITDDHSQIHRPEDTPGEGSKSAYPGGTVSSTRLNFEDHVEDDACLPWRTDSPTDSEYQMLEKRFTAAKVARALKRINGRHSSRMLQNSFWDRERWCRAADARRDSPESTTTDEYYRTDVPFEAKTSRVQRGVTMDEVEDEANIKRPTDDGPAEVPDVDEESKKSRRASTFPNAVRRSEEELERLKRGLRKAEAFSNLGAWEAMSAHRQPLRLREGDYGGRRNAAAGQRKPMWMEEQRSLGRSHEEVDRLANDKQVVSYDDWDRTEGYVGEGSN